MVNPYGVQKDYLWSNVGGGDRGFDLVWESAARLTDFGYQVEMAVPFSSLRFPNKDIQSWRVDFYRNRPRESFMQYSWAAYDRNEQCWPCQWGTLNGMTDVRPGKGLEILPTLVGHQAGQLNDYSDPNPSFENGKAKSELSLGGKYSISSALTLEGAYNPDFSQIEADAAQIDVNSTIALFYPERRPFFQEGSDIFRTIFNSFYTRTVNDPQFAVKFTGRMNRTNIGFLTALDENTPYIIPLEERSVLINTGESYVNILRASRTLAEDTHLGFIVTDRRFENDGYGTVFGLDGNIRLTQNYSIVGQYLTSLTREPDDPGLSSDIEDIDFYDGKHTASLDGEWYSGDAFITQFRRRSRHLDFTVDYNQVEPAYRTQTGYDPWNDYRNFSIYSNYVFYTDGIFERIIPQVYTDRRWNFNNERKWHHTDATLETRLSYAQTYFMVSYFTGSEKWSGVNFDNLWDIDFNLGSRISDQLGYGVYFGRGQGVARWLLQKGNETDIYAYLDLKPIDRLVIEPNFNFSRSTDTETGEELFSGYIMRTRIQFQANRELSFRFVIQYNDFGEKWEFDPLLTYRLSPFSVFYVGSTYDFDNLAADDGDPANWRMSSRQFFMKLQYLFQR
jgi:hypothetical protein